MLNNTPKKQEQMIYENDYKNVICLVNMLKEAVQRPYLSRFVSDSVCYLINIK